MPATISFIYQHLTATSNSGNEAIMLWHSLVMVRYLLGAYESFITIRLAHAVGFLSFELD